MRSPSLHLLLAVVFLPPQSSGSDPIEMIEEWLGVLDPDVVKYLGPEFADPLVVNANRDRVTVLEGHALVE